MGNSKDQSDYQPTQTALSGGALIPMIKGMIIGLTFFFFLASLWQLFYLHQHIADTPDLNLSELLTKSNSKLSGDKHLISLLELQSRVALEERYILNISIALCLLPANHRLRLFWHETIPDKIYSSSIH